MIIKKVSSGIIIIGIAYLFIEFLWKFPFILGKVPGIYWLFVFTDKTALPLAGISLVLSAIFLLVYIVMRIIRKGNYSAVGKISTALLICGIILLPTFFSIFPKNTIHLDTQKIQDRIYYLAVYPMFDDNYGFYKCDSLGIFCKLVYRSGDYTAGVYGHLIYYPESNRIAIAVNGEGLIYVYIIPKK